jgi:hypothetical protein
MLLDMKEMMARFRAEYLPDALADREEQIAAGKKAA